MTAPEFLPYKIRQHELSLLKGCLLWGSRVLVPASLRGSILSALHEDHPGIAYMKSLGRSYVWWPKLDNNIAHLVSGCSQCQLSSAAAPVALPREWESPSSPWSCLHVDCAGPIQGKTLLDAYSQWVEVIPMFSTTSDALVRALRLLFSTHGLPDIIISDNGPQLTSATFQVFLVQYGIRHAPIAPFHLASNGHAEPTVRSVKEALLKLGLGDLHGKLVTYLLMQHSTTCPLSNLSPAELLMGQHLCLTLDRMHQSYSPDVPPNFFTGVRSFRVGDLVYARNYRGDPHWVSGVTGPHSYIVLLGDDRSWRHHMD